MPIKMSPGVYWQEIDLSNYVPQLTGTNFGMVGTSSKGPVNQRTLITNLQDLTSNFGVPSPEHVGMYTASRFLSNGGILWFVRVESSEMPSTVAEMYIRDLQGNTVRVESKDTGSFYNDIYIDVFYSNPRRVVRDAVAKEDGIRELAVDLEPCLAKGSVRVDFGGKSYFDSEGKIVSAEFSGFVDYETGKLVLSSEKGFTNGTVFKVFASYYTSFGINFFRMDRRQRVTVESFSDMDLDPNSENYYATILASSKIIKVPTLASMPAPVKAPTAMAGGSDGLNGISSADFIGRTLGSARTGLQLFNNSDEVDINCLSASGNSDTAVVQALVNIANQRKDCIAIIDAPKGMDPQTVVDWVNGVNEFDSLPAIDSSYACIVFPWVKVFDNVNSREVLIPPSTFEAIAFSRSNPGDAPAGYYRGLVDNILGLEFSLDQDMRGFLYQNRVNPIADFAGMRTMIYGQKTAQAIPTKLDRIHARRLLINIEKVITTALQPLVFERNTESTRSRATTLISSYLDSLVASGYLYESKVLCDETTNPATVIDNNMLVANIYLKIVSIAERIVLNFVLLPYGARVEEYVGQSFV